MQTKCNLTSSKAPQILHEIRSPESVASVGTSLFIGGGISGCPDWQHDFLALISDQPLTAFNPRRLHFDITDPSISRQQIEWEFRHLTRADAIIFWFPEETLCPITLYELGAWSKTDKPIFIGTHPRYSRQFDVEVQMGISRPEITVVHSIEELAAQVRQWVKNDLAAAMLPNARPTYLRAR